MGASSIGLLERYPITDRKTQNGFGKESDSEDTPFRHNPTSIPGPHQPFNPISSTPRIQGFHHHLRQNIGAFPEAPHGERVTLPSTGPLHAKCRGALNTLSTHHAITKATNQNADLFAGARKSGLDIRYRTISDRFPLSFNRSLNREQFIEGRIHVFPAHVDELIGLLISGSDHPPPTCLVVDTFSTWGSNVAWKYGLVYVSFWTQPALALTLYYHHDLLEKNGHYGCQDIREDTIDYIPGVRNLEPKDSVSFLQETDTTKVMHKLIRKAFADVKNADFIICNTVEELEPESISALKQNQTVYAIGPLLPPRFVDRMVQMDLWAETDCSHWLNSKPQGSVLYASFRSYAHGNKNEIKTIAAGIMASGLSFIWVLRPDIVDCEVMEYLPDRYFEDTRDQGMVVPWCKQNAVLSHSAVGGYLTHCGWNSILESVWARVPLVCFPLLGKSGLIYLKGNWEIAVDDWKIGINLS